MPDTLVRAATEGMPAISRRNFMRVAASAGAVAVGAATGTAVASPSLIGELGATLRAAKAAHRNVEARFNELFAAGTGIEMPELGDASDAEWYAFEAVLDYRPRDIEEVRRKIGHLVEYAGDDYGRERIEEHAVEILRSMALGGDGRV